MKNLRLGLVFAVVSVCAVVLIATDNITHNASETPTKNLIVGTHLMAEFLDCCVPEDPKELEKMLRAAARDAGSTDLEFSYHKFEPHGITAVLILAESHISVHYWYDEKYAAVDAFTCGGADSRKAIDSLKRAFNAENVKVSEVARGQI